MRLSVTAFVVAMAAGVSQAGTYYVAPTGSNSAAGTDAAPWATLQHAADTVHAGDTVIVRAGDYQGFNLETSGTSGAEIVFKADPNARITSDNPQTTDGINLEGASFVRLEDFTITGATRAGIRAVTCEHVTIRGVHADQNGRWGIFTGFCDDLLIENNVTSRSVAEHGIYVSNSGDRPVIRNNVSWGNNANGIHMNGDISTGGDGVISDAIVEDNVVYGNGAAGGSGINGDGVQGALIRNNLLYDNHASGISLYQIDGGAPSTGNTIVNNTVVMASNGRWAINIQDASTGNTLRNNILLHLGSRGAVDICGACMSGFSSNYNVVTGVFTVNEQQVTFAQWKSMTGGDAASMAGTQAQLFTNPAMSDYTLLPTSPAVDSGTTEDAPELDLAGNPRPQGTAIDIGALELCSGGQCLPPPDPGGGSGSDGSGSGSDGSGSGSGSDGNPPGGTDYDGGGGTGLTGGCAAGGSAGAALIPIAFGLVRRRRRA